MDASPPVETKNGQKQRRRSWLIYLALALICVACWGIRQWPARDWWNGLWYQASDRAAAIAESLDLTDTGRRILAATRPAVELRDDFNTHCDSHRVEISLLGCYTSGRIYVYEITQPELVDSNKVTMAHELLHAAWERMSNRDHQNIAELLEQVKIKNSAWFDEELALYSDSDKIEEAWARAGTKLADLSDELEAYYREYFNNRQTIVSYYEHYQAPFLALREKNENLYNKIIATRDEVVLEKESYLNKVASLDRQIGDFNDCANTMGCFKNDEEFQLARSELIAEQERLDRERITLNEKIDENNTRIEEYSKNQLAIGELSDAMNSNVVSEKIE